jgi:hypothetical protein
LRFSRINLTQTNYKSLSTAKILNKSEIDVEFYNNDIIAYYDNDKIEAFSMIGRYDNKNAENYQFAWTYHNPNLMLGLKSLEHECATYKALGYDYLYLGGPDNYKQQFDGFEILGPI